MTKRMIDGNENYTHAKIAEQWGTILGWKAYQRQIPNHNPVDLFPKPQVMRIQLAQSYTRKKQNEEVQFD